jgi:hypothetical protein
MRHSGARTVRLGTALLVGALISAAASLPSQASPLPRAPDIALPPPGHLYHGVYPGGRTGEEDDLLLSDLTS